jgi:hypothetical protein
MCEVFFLDFGDSALCWSLLVISPRFSNFAIVLPLLFGFEGLLDRVRLN